MSIFQAFILGLVQGLGELLPISSSAHLTLVPWLFGWPDPGLSFDVALHLGTLIAVVVYFWRDWWDLLRHGLRRGISSVEGRMFWFLVAASVPGAIAGYALESQAETTFRSPLRIGILLAVVGIVLYLADRYGKKTRRAEDLTFGQSLIIGLSQALAILPGVSRSGATITAALFLGLTRESAARFSFLLSTPIIIGAGLYNLRHLAGSSGALNAPFLVGVVTAAVVGFLVIGFLLSWLKKRSFLPFVWYRLFLGAAVVVVYFIRG